MSTVSNALVRSQRKILHLMKSLRERCNRLNGECGNSKNGGGVYRCKRGTKMAQLQLKWFVKMLLAVRRF